MKALSVWFATITLFGLTAAAEPVSGQFAIKMSIEENGTQIAHENMVVDTAKPYTINLAASYKLTLKVAGDTGMAAKRALDRDLGDLSKKFIFVDAALSMEVETPSDGVQRKEVISAGMLVPIQYDKEIRAAADILDQSLVSSNGERLSALAFTVNAKPFLN